MLVLSGRLLHCAIMSLQTGAPLGETTEAIIDPRQLTIVAFKCEGPGVDFSPAYLHTADIREFGSMGIIVNSSENLMPNDDLVRLNEVLEFKFTLIDKQVVDQTGQKLGKVSDYTVDNNSFQIMQLQVQPSLFKSLTSPELIVRRQQIIDVTNKKIIVKSGLTKIKLAETPQQHPMQAFQNPFRHTQPEQTTTRSKT